MEIGFLSESGRELALVIVVLAHIDPIYYIIEETNIYTENRKWAVTPEGYGPALKETTTFPYIPMWSRVAESSPPSRENPNPFLCYAISAATNSVRSPLSHSSREVLIQQRRSVATF